MRLCEQMGERCESRCAGRANLCGLARWAWPSKKGLAVALLWDPAEQQGVLWTNRRLVRGRLDRLIWHWAVRRISTGTVVAALSAHDLAELPAELLALSV